MKKLDNRADSESTRGRQAWPWVRTPACQAERWFKGTELHSSPGTWETKSCLKMGPMGRTLTMADQCLGQLHPLLSLSFIMLFEFGKSEDGNKM